MESLYRPLAYPPAIRAKLLAMPALAIEIANRWMRGWPKAVEFLMDSGEYLHVLAAQEEEERRIYSEPGNQHLARHEIAELYGLSPKPPMSG